MRDMSHDSAKYLPVTLEETNFIKIILSGNKAFIPHSDEMHIKLIQTLSMNILKMKNCKIVEMNECKQQTFSVWVLTRISISIESFSRTVADSSHHLNC